MKIGTITSKSTSVIQYQVRDIMAGLAKNGHETKIHYTDDLLSGARLMDWLSSLDLYLAVSTDRRYMSPIFPSWVPILTYDQDWVTKDLMPGDLHKNDMVFTMLRRWGTDLQGRGIAAHSLRAAVNTDVFHRLEGVERDIDVLFVGNNYPGRDVDFLEQLRQVGWYEQTRRLYEEYKGGDLLVDPLSLIDESCIVDCPVGVKHLFLLMCHHYHRQYHIKELAKSVPGLQVYGEGWDFLGAQAKGTVRNGPDLNRLLNRAKIVLHLHPLTVNHPRVYEAMACGALVVANHTNDIGQGRYFWDGVYIMNDRRNCLILPDIVGFEDCGDAVEIIERALLGSDDYEDRASLAEERVLEYNTWDVRAGQMMAIYEDSRNVQKPR